MAMAEGEQILLDTAMAAMCSAAVPRGAFLLIVMFQLVQLQLNSMIAASARDLPSQELPADAQLHVRPVPPPSLNPDVVHYWRSKLGSTPLPQEWTPSLVSRLSPEQVTRFGQAIASGDLLSPSRNGEAAAFCSASGIICSSQEHGELGAFQKSSGFSQPDIDHGQTVWPYEVLNREQSKEEKEKETFSEPELALARQRSFLQENLPAPGAKARAFLFSTGSDENLQAANSNPAAFLPRALVSALDKLEWMQLLQTLRVQRNSSLAAAMASTYHTCTHYHGAVGNEVRACSQSVEDVADFVSAHVLAQERGSARVRTETSGAVVSDQHSIASSFLEVVSVERLGVASRPNVLCHPLGPFPYMVQACHSIQDTELYSVMLRTSAGENQPAISVSNVVACHLSTSTFFLDHIVFQALGLKPGQAALCQWSRPGVTAFYSLP